MKKRIFGTNLYVTIDGKVEDVDGNQLPTKKKEGGNYFVKISQSKVRSVAKLVAEAFIGPYNPRYNLVHLDGDKSNNAAYNLEYCKKESIIFNEWEFYKRVSNDTKAEIVRKLEEGVAIDDLGVEYGMPSSMILFIKNKFKNT